MKRRNGFDSIPQYEDDFKVHHLGINASQIGEGVILTSNIERAALIAGTFDHSEHVGEHREYTTFTGEKHGVRMSVMSIGNGCMPTAIAVEELRHIGCRKMIKVGTCSAIAYDVEPGTIIIPTSACRCEGATLEYVNLQYPAVADYNIFFALVDAAKEMNIQVKTGIIRTHDALFLESRFAHEGMEARITPWRELGVLAVDNEVAAMLTIASILGSQAGSVLVAVDNLSNGCTIDFKKDYDRLIYTAIKIASLALAKIIKGYTVGSGKYE